MDFRTEVKLEKSSLLIEHHNKIVTIGSCFAENIAGYFDYYRFSVMDNPFGVLYNPASIYNAVKLLKDEKVFTEKDLFKDQDEWHSFYHHSDFSHHKAEVCLQQINDGLNKTADYISGADYLIITYGTAYVYKLVSDNMIVSNCHKLPAKYFNRFRLSVDEVKRHINSTLELLQQINSNLKIIFTISPVRHWKDGAVDNQLSKSVLLLAVSDAIKENDNSIYFPSYEIIMDDLRDYRFYGQDLVHPNKIATDYIWQKFSAAHLSGQCEKIIKEIEPVAKARLHRPRNIYSVSGKKFTASMLKKIEALETKYTHLSLTDDREHFNKLAEDINSADD